MPSIPPFLRTASLASYLLAPVLLVIGGSSADAPVAATSSPAKEADTAPAPGGLSGAWFDPSHDGEGIVLEVLEGGEALLYWFTYDRQGEQRWFFGIGHFSGSILKIDALEISDGGRFGAGFDPDQIDYRTVGEAQFEFQDCRSARFDYVIDGESGRQELEPLTRPAGLDCGLDAANPVVSRGAFSGSWFDPSHDGEGFVVQVLDEGVAVVFWFTYQPDGGQAWLIGTGQLDDGALVFDQLLMPRGGLFGSDFSPDQVEHLPWGKLAMEMDCAAGSALYESELEGFGAGEQDLVRLTRLAGLVCPAGDAADPPSEVGADVPVAFTNVNLVSMTRPTAVPDQTVLVADGRIQAVGDDGEVDLPEQALAIDGRDRFLMPGLADMHVHVNRGDLERYLAHGVTTVRNLWGFPDVQAMQAEIRQGTLRGPTIYSVSPGLDASPPRWPYTQIVDQPSQADAVVRTQQENGWTTLKLYQKLSRASYDAIVASARSRGLDYVGHTPTAVGIHRVLEAGQRSVEHLGGYERALNGTGLLGVAGWVDAATGEPMDALATKTRQHDVWNCPTLAIQLNMGQSLPTADRNLAAANRRRMVKALHDAGAGLLVGTDSGIDVTSPGASIHTELAEFVQAGLSPYEALLGATREAAAFLNVAGEFGVIQPGARADLLLVEENPLSGLQTLRQPTGVMTRGHWTAR